MTPLLLILIILLITSYYLLTKNKDYWKNKNVFTPRNTHFLFGNVKNTFLGRTSLMKEIAELYKETKREPYAGIYLFKRPALLINDLDMVRSVLNKDFEHFTDRPIRINFKTDPIADHLFNATGSRWRNMRAKMTPTFTSNKMREMFHYLEECCKEMVSFLNENQCDCDVKELLAKLTTNIIGTCAFGIECNSFKDPDSKFRRMGGRFFSLPWWRNLLLFLNIIAPSFVRNLRVSILGKELNDFFYNLVKDGIDHRKRNGIVRKDFLQILMQMLKDDDDETSDDGTKLTLRELSAQAFVFFVAGFETSSTVASYVLYELALNPDIQNRLRMEIKTSLKSNDDKITYESLREIKYLQQVIDETMRKYPTISVLLRVCTKDYRIPDTDIIIERNTPVFIPVLGIESDPDIYPNPEKFDPDRFSDENKSSRHNFAFLPFGEGPRNCIGNRFGLMQTKLALVTILLNYDVSTTEKTTIPIVYNPRTFILQSKDGIWLRLRKITMAVID